ERAEKKGAKMIPGSRQETCPLGSITLLCALGVLGGEKCRPGIALPGVIDGLVEAAQARGKVQPAALADDAEVVRRVYLDLVGRIPTGEEARAFCASREPSKRDRLVEALLTSGEFARHWRENFHVLLMGGPAFGGAPEWRAWLETALRQNKGWDVIARALL